MIEVAPSAGAGRGVHALRAIARGEVIESAPALLVPKAESDDVLASFLEHYIFQTDDGRHYVIGLGFTSLVNHAQRPNAEFFVTTSRLTIVARRAIKAGEEITVDYGWTAREWKRVGGRRG